MDNGVTALSQERLTISGMSEKLFGRFSQFIEGNVGIKMPPSKKTMLEGRLRKRMRKLGYTSYDTYADYVFSEKGRQQEIVHMLDVVTTNKTDFFREPSHFEYMKQKVLPDFISLEGRCARAHLRVWSAGCSTGEEPYTLAIVLSEFGEQYSQFRFSILATDLSTQVLEKASAGIYDDEKIEPIAPQIRKKYLLRGKGSKKHLVRIVPELRNAVTFRRLNFMDNDLNVKEKMHIIFCRNVIIYFDRQRQEVLLNKFCRYLHPGGYLFMGHSETLSGLDVPLRQVAPTVYRLSV